MTTTFFPEQINNNIKLIKCSFTQHVNRSPTIEEIQFWHPKLMHYSYDAINFMIESHYSQQLTTRTTLLQNPIAQSFFVNEDETPNGVFIESVYLYFSRIDVDFPSAYSIEIRPLENGYPAITNIVQGSNRPMGGMYPKAKVVDQVAIIDKLTPAVGTGIYFENPIYLPPGGYALVILSDSDEFQLMGSKLDDQLLGTTGVLKENTVLGNLFKSQNARTWDPDLTMDLCFTINRCSFDPSGQSTIKFITGNKSIYTDYEYDVIKLIGDSKTFEELDKIQFYLTQNNAFNQTTTEEVLLNQTINNSEPKTIKVDGHIGLEAVYSQGSGGDNKVSPVIVSDTIKSYLIRNYINKWRQELSDSELLPMGGMRGDISTANNAGILPTTSFVGSNSIAQIVSITSKANTNLIDGDFISIPSYKYFSEDYISVDNGIRPMYPVTVTGEKSFTIPVKFPQMTKIDTGKHYWKLNNPRYITKAVTLEDGFDASALTVYLSTSRPKGTRVEVFYKVFSYEDSNPNGIDSRPWVLMQPSSAISYDLLSNTTNGEYISDVFQDLDTSYVDLIIDKSLKCVNGDTVYQEVGGIRSFSGIINYYDSSTGALYLTNIGGTIGTIDSTIPLKSSTFVSMVYNPVNIPQVIEVDVSPSGGSFIQNEMLYISNRSYYSYTYNSSPFIGTFQKYESDKITIFGGSGQLRAFDRLSGYTSGVSRYVKDSNIFNFNTFRTFKQFQIKIVMYSDSTAIIPEVKDLRIIATP